MISNKKNNPSKTVLTICIGFCFIFLYFDYKWSLYLALSIGLLGVVSDKISSAIDFLWMKLAKVLSLIIPNLLLTAIFFLCLFPIALLQKLFSNKNTLKLKNNTTSLWSNTTEKISKSSFEKMW